MDSIDSKVIYQSHQTGITVRLDLVPDSDSRPQDSECYSDADVEAWQNDAWRYVGVVATVEHNGEEIGSDSVWGVEHGSLSEVECDAFGMIAGHAEGNTITMGSPAYHVVADALSDAHTHLAQMPTPTSLGTVFDTFGMAVPGDSSPDEAAVSAARVIMHSHPQGLTGALPALRAMGVSESIIGPAEQQERVILSEMFRRAINKLGE